MPLQVVKVYNVPKRAKGSNNKKVPQDSLYMLQTLIYIKSECVLQN